MVGVDIGTGVFKAVAHPGLRGEVHDDIGLKVVRDTIQRVGVFQHRLGRGETGFLQQHLVAALFQGDIVIIGHSVQPMDDEPFLQQEIGQVIADEPRRAGDENPCHAARPLLSRTRTER